MVTMYEDFIIEFLDDKDNDFVVLFDSDVNYTITFSDDEPVFYLTFE